MLGSHLKETFQHMKPWKIGVKTNILMMMKDFGFISGKNLLKQINEMKATTTV